MAVKEGLATPDGPPADFKGNIRVDDKLPTRKELAKAGEIEVFDKDNKAHKFSSLYTHTDGVARTCLVIFIRHFFCGVSPPCLSSCRMIGILSRDPKPPKPIH